MADTMHALLTCMGDSNLNVRVKAIWSLANLADTWVKREGQVSQIKTSITTLGNIMFLPVGRLAPEDSLSGRAKLGQPFWGTILCKK
jgi:hypothetical protein